MTDKTPTTCSSCLAPIYWAITDTGKRMPVDAEPVADGNCTMVLRGSTGQLHVKVWPRSTDIPVERNRYTSHFATCPHAEDYRK